MLSFLVTHKHLISAYWTYCVLVGVVLSCLQTITPLVMLITKLVKACILLTVRIMSVLGLAYASTSERKYLFPGL
jgi:hypothetical protein